MTINRDRAVGTKHFTGQSNVQHDRDDGLAAILRESLVRDGQAALAAAAVLTADNSGGTAGVTFTATAADDTITLGAVAADSLITGDGPFQLAAGGGLPTGLAASTDYWVRVVSSNVATLHLTKAAALSAQSTPVTISDAGTPPNALLALGQPVALVVSDLTGAVTGFTAASFDTSVDTVAAAHATLATKINLALALIGAGSIDVGPGTVTADTVAVIDADVAANTDNDTATTYGSAQAAVVELFEAQATLVDAVNVCLVAGGLVRIPQLSNLVGPVDAVGIAGGGTFTNGVVTSDATIDASALEAGIEAILAGLADNVAYIYDKIDEVAGITAATTIARFAG